MAPLSSQPPAHPRSIADVLDSGFVLFRTTLAQCMPYGALLVLAGLLGNVRDLVAGRPLHGAGAHDAGWWTWYAIGLVLMLALWSALLLRQSALAAGRAGSLSRELRSAFRRLPQLVALTLLAAAAVALGLLLLVVPGVYLAVAFVFAAPALLLHGPQGPVRALVESARLVRGSWWRTMLSLVIVILLTIVVYVVLATIITAAFAAIATTANPALIAAVSVIAGVLVGSVIAPFGSAMVLAIFGDLSGRARTGSG